MNQPNKIAVIGGTGKSGKYLVQTLLKRGFSIQLLLRNPANFSINSPLITVIEGDIRNYEDAYALLKGCTAVLSTLGQPKGESSIFSTATKNVLQAMKTLGIQRYIVTTGISVNTPLDNKNPKAQFGTNWMYENFPATTSDKQVEYDTLTKSDVDWTLIRLPLINLTDEKGEVVADLKDCLGEKINAADLAEFMLNTLLENTFVKVAPFIATRD